MLLKLPPPRATVNVAMLGSVSVIEEPPMSKEILASIPLADLPEGGMRACDVQGREIVVCRTRDGIYALDNICSHAYARLSEGRLRGTRLICPLHGASFDVRDGRVLGAPAARALATHGVRVDGDHLEVTITPAEVKPLTV
jgi:3-phenylpropionate/trans-cinnamate dioxygenase ferredoxin subunit